MSIVNSYEIVMVFSVSQGEEATAALVEKFKTLITDNASEVSVDEWGKRKLAYEINGLTDGDYTLVNFHADPQNVAELDRVLRINDAVVRHMIVKREDRD